MKGLDSALATRQWSTRDAPTAEPGYKTLPWPKGNFPASGQVLPGTLLQHWPSIWSVILSTWVWMLRFKVLVGEKLLLASVTQDPAAGQ